MPLEKIRLDVADGGSASLAVIAPTAEKDGLLAIAADPDQLENELNIIWDEWDFDRLRIAAGRVLELDARALSQFRAGNLVTKVIPRQDSNPLPSPDVAAGVDDYRRLRSSVGKLVRPLLTPLPQGAPLMPYQRTGADWLAATPKAILADQPGLGKTLQAIHALHTLIAQGKVEWALVVAPRSLLAVWEFELARWAPELSRLRVVPYGPDQERCWSVVIGRIHVLITTYEQIRQAPAALRARTLDLVIADEVHRVRNLTAALTRGLRELQWSRFWGLTGTPIERDAADLTTLLATLEPRRFSSRDGDLPVATLRSRARPYMLRRLKADVLSELPDVIDGIEPLDLLPEQRAAYDQAIRDPKYASGSDLGFLALLNELRRICDFDPSTGASIKVERIVEIATATTASSEKMVVFSYLIAPLDLLQRALQSAGIRAVVLQGSMGLPEREAALTKFREDSATTVLLASSRVAGEGLTLTEANHVAFFNEWWNPSANLQARDRVVRIGQHRGVRVYRFRCRDTVEEALDRVLARKDAATATIVDELATTNSPGDAARGLLKEVQQETGWRRTSSAATE